MSVRTKNFLLCTFALLIGAIVYILFRPTSMVAVIVGDNRWLTQLRSWLKPVSYGFVRYYLGDFLWMLALCCGLYAVLLPKPRERILCIFGSVLLGVAWELLQWLGAIAGTGDWFDIFAYGMAGIASYYNQPEGDRKMKFGKWVLAILLVAVFLLFALGSGETGDQGSSAADTKPSESDEKIGKYSVSIDSCRLAEDYEGKPVVIVKYIFQNVSDENAVSFSFTFDDAVFQNGVGLNESYVLQDDANYSSDNQLKEIKKGASLEVEVAYELNDSETDIEVEVKELISFNDKTLKKTFKIS